MSLNGRVVCFTGTLTTPRAQAKVMAVACGGTVVASVTAKCDLLVAGPGAGAKGAAAAKKGIDVWDEAAFTKACSGTSTTSAAPKKKAPAKRKPAAAAAAPAAKPAKKAKKAAAAPAASAGGTIPIEAGLRDQSGCFGQLGSNPRVDGDYAWLGNQTNIGPNNNKFYRGQVITNDNGQFFSWTRWGRVGLHGQSNLDGPTDQASAVKAFTKKFKDKSSFAWSGGDFSYPECKATKYAVIHEKHSSDQGAKLAGSGLGDDDAAAEPVKYAPAKIKGKLADFTNMITSADMFADQLKTMGVDVSKMPLGDIDQRTIDSGMGALLELEKEFKKKSPNRTVIETLCSKFYTYIPHAFGMKAPPMLKSDDIQKKKDMLNVIGDVGAAVQTQKKTRKKKAAKGKKAPLEPAPIDAKYESLGSSLAQVDSKSKEFKNIVTYTENTQGYRKCKVADVFRVEDCANAEDFSDHTESIGNRKLLWHGTNVAVVAAILKSGLRIMPHSGGRVGSGVYLASENGKSAGYCTAQGHDGVMFLVEAALGKQKIVTSDGQVGYNDKDPVSASGHDSCLAVGRTEPDAKKDTTMEFDGQQVCVPQGKVGDNPALKKHGGSTSYSQSEYLLYNEKAVRIRYVIRMKFETAGGHWH